MRIYVKSFGCSLNIADGEVMAGCLKEEGFDIVNELDYADIVIYNTCAVKAPTENRMIYLLKKAPGEKRLIVTGCLPFINFERLEKEVRFDGIIGPAPGKDIVKIVKEIMNGKRPIWLKEGVKPSLNLPYIPTSPIIDIVPIAYGCLGECSYCCVKFARGQLRSYSIDEIIERVRAGLKRGAREIWLTAQDSACYGRDLGIDLPILLKEVTKLKSDFFVRVGMMSPNHVVDILDELIEAYKSRKVFKFLHIPVQSADNDVLKAMKRRYTVEDFEGIIRAFRESIPNITIATDFICGFPTETDEAFKKSLQLIEKLEFDLVNISKFFPRPKTFAKAMKQLPSYIVKGRSRKMTLLAKRISLERNRKWIGWVGKIVIDEKGKGKSWIGRNFAYKPIVIQSDENLIGKELTVEAIRAYPYHLEGRII